MSKQTVDMVRSCHPYAFRSGEWAEIVTTLEHDGRSCWLAKWPDGVTDFLPVEDAVAKFEFAERDR